jgi:hydrogenase-4 component B
MTMGFAKFEMINDQQTLYPAYFFTSASSLWLAGICITIIGKEHVKSHFLAFLMLAGCILTIAGAAISWTGTIDYNQLQWLFFGLAPADSRVDPLSTPFVMLLGLLGSASAIASPSHISSLGNQSKKEKYWLQTFILMIGMLQVLLAANAVSFLVFWEIMSLSSAALVAADHARHRAQKAAFAYLTATRISTAFITAAFLWMHQNTGSWLFADWHFNTEQSLVAALLLLLGVCAKIGIWPMHVWLPLAYPEPPAPTSALFSGLISKLAIFLLMRLLLVGECSHTIVAYIAIALGIISALWGVLFALMERDLKKLLAYSSVENMGLILAAIGVAILAHSHNLGYVAVLAAMAALFHAFNHGIVKALLFLGASSVERSAHTRDLSVLGGLSKNMPWTMLCFFIGSLSICALPPSNCFASKWLIYQTFFHLSSSQAPILERAMSLAILGILAFVGALSLACFTKAVGIAFLGRPRSSAAAKAKESIPGSPDGLILAQILLCFACIWVCTSVPIALNGLSPAVELLTHNASIVGSSLYSIPQGQLVLIGVILFTGIYMLILGGRSGDIKSYNTWDCGFGPLSTRAEETGSSFSHPIGRIFSQILQLRVTTKIAGKDRRHFPDSIKVETLITPIIETKLYQAAINILNWLSSSLVRLQTGSIHIHLLYVFLTMVLLVFLGTNL